MRPDLSSMIADVFLSKQEIQLLLSVISNSDGLIPFSLKLVIMLQKSSHPHIF